MSGLLYKPDVEVIGNIYDNPQIMCGKTVLVSREELEEKLKEAGMPVEKEAANTKNKDGNNDRAKRSNQPYHHWWSRAPYRYEIRNIVKTCDSLDVLDLRHTPEFIPINIKKETTKEDRQKAIDWVFHRMIGPTEDEVNVAGRIAISDMEKQIPKKPNISLHGTTDFNTKVTCPSCHGMVFTEKYCRHCGQKIDWRDSNGQIH